MAADLSHPPSGPSHLLQEVAIITPTYPSLATDPARLKLDSYPIQFELPTRLSDVVDGNRIGFVGMARYYEEARKEFVGAIIGTERHHSGEWMAFMRRNRIEVLGDITFPDLLTVGGGVRSIGNTSYSFGFAMFQHGQCISLSNATCVWVDGNGRPTAASDEIKAMLAKEQLRA